MKTLISPCSLNAHSTLSLNLNDINMYRSAKGRPPTMLGDFRFVDCFAVQSSQDHDLGPPYQLCVNEGLYELYIEPS